MRKNPEGQVTLAEGKSRKYYMAKYTFEIEGGPWIAILSGVSCGKLGSQRRLLPLGYFTRGEIEILSC
jgi:hypothetical protein